MAIVQRYLAKVLAAQEGEADRVARLLAAAAEIRAAGEVAAGRAMTVVQGLDYAVGWADQRGKRGTGPT